MTLTHRLLALTVCVVLALPVYFLPGPSGDLYALALSAGVVVLGVAAMKAR